MDHQQHGKIVSFIWNIADDVLRGSLNRTKYRDVILPMTVIRRLDALLEPTKAAVLERDRLATERNIGAMRHGMLQDAARQPFYNTSEFTLRDLTANPKNIHDNLLAYLDGYSENVRVILDRFNFRGHLHDLHRAERLGLLIEQFTSPAVNLGPHPHNGLPGLDNHAMGTVFEELLRRFNEQNNEEAGEHFTPRDVVNLMADLAVVPVAERLADSVYTVYDGACGTGGMLSVSAERIRGIAAGRGFSPSVHVYGQELNPETWAIAQADQLVQGQPADNIRLGSTLGDDQFPTMRFEFMISNPPYGVSWKADQEKLGGKSRITDPRFVIQHEGDPDYSLLTRSSDGQLLFLANLLAKMKHDTPLGSRIAEIHNGSSLFTGDAGQGESNIRRWIIENDWLEAIIALPNNMFYNTGIATYIWVLTNRKPEHRRGLVQLIDATKRFTPRRKNLGAKNVDLGADDIQAIMADFLAFDRTDTSKIFPNEAFGYRKVTVDRPLRLRVDLPSTADTATSDAVVADAVGADPRRGCPPGRPQGDNGLPDAFAALPKPVRDALLAVAADRPTWDNWNAFEIAFTAAAKRHGLRLTAALRKQVRSAVATRDEDAAPVLARATRLLHAAGDEGDPLHGRIVMDIDGHPYLVEFEPDPDLRDTEQIPLTEYGGVAGFIAREVLPYADDVWVVPGSERIGYEISFTRYFYQPKEMRTLVEIEADIRALEAETEGLLEDILGTSDGDAAEPVTEVRVR